MYDKLLYFQIFVWQYGDLGTYGYISYKFGNILVPAADTAFCGHCADRLWETCSMYSDAGEARHRKSYEIWTVGSLDHTFAIAEVMFPRCRVIYHLDGERSFRSFAIAYRSLCSRIFSICDVAMIQRIILLRKNSKSKVCLRNDNSILCKYTDSQERQQKENEKFFHN